VVDIERGLGLRRGVSFKRREAMREATRMDPGSDGVDQHVVTR
jgi:hypothetical protein